MSRQAVIFDLDGVIVSTDEYHYRAWQRMADEQELRFDRAVNERLRGVSRMESLAIILDHSGVRLAPETMAELASKKNAWYRDSLAQLTPQDVLPGALPLLSELRARGIRQAIGSSSKNARTILDRIGLRDWFDAVADGNGIVRSKPDPEVFLLAARLLGVVPETCVVVEDAEAGLAAARAAGMKAVGVGAAANSPLAHCAAKDLTGAALDEWLA